MTTSVARADSLSGVPGTITAPAEWFVKNKAYGIKHIRVKGNGATVVLALVNTYAETGEQLIVTPSTLGLANGDTAEVQCELLTESAYRRDWLAHTRAGQLTLAGLVIAAIGQAFQIAVDLGSAWSVFDVGATGIALAKTAKSVLTVGGASLVFWQALLKG